MARSKKSNLINNRKVTKNFIKTPKDIIHKNNMKPITRLIYIYLLGLDARKVNVSSNLISSFFDISEPSVARAIKELKDNKLIDIERVGKKDYVYTILEQGQESQANAEQDQEEQQESQADAGTKKEDKKTDAEEQEIIEDLEELTEDKKKINRYNELYNEYCAECTSIAKANKSKIIYIIDTYSEEDIIKTLIYFNDFIKANKGKYKENYKYLVTNFNEVNKMKDSYNKAPKNNNKFYNFKGRNYTKEDFKELEKSFFNNNSDVGADAEQEEQQEKNKVKYIAVGTSKEIAETYIKDRGLAEYKNNIINDIYKIHNPSNSKEYKRALEVECKKYNNIMMQKI